MGRALPLRLLEDSSWGIFLSRAPRTKASCFLRLPNDLRGVPSDMSSRRRVHTGITRASVSAGKRV